jgi:hypothetical protein
MRGLASTLTNLRLTRMEDWSRQNLVPVTPRGRTLLYPFGGPDLLHAEALFGHLRSKVLMGLEPVGSAPDLESMDDARVFATLRACRQATKFHLLAGFFDTKDMQSELGGTVLGGVTPVLLTTVAMMGGSVKEVHALRSAPDSAIELRYRNRSGASRSAIYLRADLSDRGFAASRPLLDSFSGGTTYFKAASYLLHDDSFRQARDYFLTRSDLVLQDDSGIPFRLFQPTEWMVRLHGTYQQPIGLFSQYLQPDLREAYRSQAAAPLPFGAGYHYLPASANLLLAVRR